MVSMKDISIACGVSVASVSKALNDRDDISLTTKKRIQETASKMGYFPNSAAKALKTNKSYNIGVLFADEARSGLTHDYFSYVLDSFKRTAEANGYDITFINCCKMPTHQMSYLAHAKYRGFDGIVIACVNFQDDEVLDLIHSDLPVVTIDHIFNNRIAVVSDNIKGMYDLVHYCYDMGHKKIAYIHGIASAVTQNRLSSFFKTVEELHLQIPDSYIAEAAYRDTNAAYYKTLELLNLSDPPTCILYPDDFSGFGGINAITKSNLKIPDDISIAGYDGIRLASQIRPELTTIRQDTETLGQKAAEKLISLIEHPRTTLVERLVIEGSLYPGQTIKKL